MKKRILTTALVATVMGLGTALPAHAAVDPEVAYILNSLLFLIGGFLVMWMAAGFCMLEAGLVRTKKCGHHVCEECGPLCPGRDTLFSGGI